MKQNVRVLTQGAMMLSVIGVFLVLNLQSAGLLEVYLIWLLPLPIIFYLVRFGLRAGFILSISATFLSFILGTWITVFYVVTALAVGLVYGYGVYKDKNNGWLLTWTTLVSAISLFLEMYALASFFGYDLVAETQEIINMLKGMDELVIPADMQTLVLAIYPIALLLMAFLQSLVTHLFAIVMLKRLKITTRKMNPIQNYRLPLWAAILALIGLFMGVLMNQSANEQIRIGLMVLMTLSALTLVGDGYIFIILYARKRGLRWLPMVSMLSLILLPTLAIYVFIGLGLMDAMTDLRQRVLNA